MRVISQKANNKMRNSIDFDDAIQEACKAASKGLTEARLSTHLLSAFPGTLPETLEQAYAIQSESIKNWSDRVAGWKVAMMPVPQRAHLGAERLSGPIFSRSVLPAKTCTDICMPIYPIGFSAVEAEFVLVMGKTVTPQQRDYSDAELATLVKEMRIGIEIASSPLKTINDIGPLAVVSDFGNNAGLVVGPVVKDGVSRALNSLHVKVDIDEKTVGEASAENIPGGPLQALRYLLNVCAVRNITVSEGEFISTGAVTGVHDVDLASNARIEFADLGWFNLKFDAIKPYR